MPSDRRTLALLPLSLVGCVLPTSLGDVPSSTASSATTGSGDVVTSGIITAGSTVAPLTMTGESGIGEPPPPHAWAMRHDEWSSAFDTGGGAETGANSGGTGGDTGGSDGGGGVPSPDTLVVQLSTGPDDCDDPHVLLECGGTWTLTLMIPPELQVPGTYDLAFQLSATATASNEPEEDSGCSFGAGTIEGTAELFEVSPQQVVGRLSVTSGFGFDPNGDFVAPRC